MSKKVSINDLALAAGVSKTLVSMVLNGKAKENGISPNTEQKVIEIAKKLQYKPNQFARGLRLGKSQTIGFIVPDISNSFYAKLARSIEDEARKEKYSVIICSSDEDVELEKSLLRFMAEKQVDGIILASTQTDTDFIVDIFGDDFPIILIDRVIENSPYSHIKVNNEHGIKMATDYLVAKGHKKIALLTIAPSHLSTQKERINGYVDALQRHKIAIKNDFIIEIPYKEVNKAICAYIQEWRDNNDVPTAIIAANNNIAMGCLDCIINNKLSIPDEISLISFDDIDVFHFSNPSVTAISQPMKDLGYFSYEMLSKKIKSLDNVIENIMLDTTLIVRNSVKNV